MISARRLLLLFGALLSLSPGFGTTVITGSAPAGYAGIKIHLILNKETISGRQRKAATDTIATDGSFRFEFEIEQGQTVGLQLMLRDIAFHISPGEHIAVNIRAFKNPDNFIEPLRFSINYLKTPDGVAVDSVYNNYETAIAQYVSLLDARMTPSELGNSLKVLFDSLDLYYETYRKSDTVFDRFTQYQRAQAMLLSNRTPETLFAMFLKGRPVYYNDEGYIRFFKNVMTGHIRSVLFTNRKEAEKLLAQYDIYQALMLFFEKDSLLYDKEMRSLALILFAQKAIYGMPDERDNYLALLEQAKTQAESSIQREIATAILKRKTWLKPPSKAPDLPEFISRQGKAVRIPSKRYDFTYLVFHTPGTYKFELDKQVFQSNIYKKNAKKVRVVVVIIRFNKDNWFDDVPADKNNVSYVYFNRDYGLLENYGIKTIPAYFLLDKDGYLLRSPAGDPAETMNYILKLTPEKSRRKTYEIIDE